MNLKQLATFTTMALISITSTRADYETLNIFGGLGVGFGMGGIHERSTNNTSNEVKDRFFNYGGGLKLDAGCQYKLMDNVALQGSFSYSYGIPTFKIINENSPSDKLTVTYGRHLFGIKLHILPKFQVLDLLDMYAGVGTGFYWTSCPFEIVNETSSGKQEASGNITTSPSLGFSGLFGTDYPLSDKITLFGELGFEQISFNRSKFKVDESNITGYRAGSVYNYEMDATGTNNLPPEKVPGSSFQFRFGIRYAIK